MVTLTYFSNNRMWLLSHPEDFFPPFHTPHYRTEVIEHFQLLDLNFGKNLPQTDHPLPLMNSKSILETLFPNIQIILPWKPLEKFCFFENGPQINMIGYLFGVIYQSVWMGHCQTCHASVMLQLRLALNIHMQKPVIAHDSKSGINTNHYWDNVDLNFRGSSKNVTLIFEKILMRNKGKMVIWVLKVDLSVDIVHSVFITWSPGQNETVIGNVRLPFSYDWPLKGIIGDYLDSDFKSF